MSLTLPASNLYVCARESVRGSTRHVLLLVLIAAAIISSPGSRSSSSAQTPPRTRLIPGKSISQDIAPGSVQTFEADLKEGECLHLVFKKNDLRLLVTVQDP